MEGDLERIDMTKKSTKIYFAHLFNDTFVISTKWKGMGYKFHRAVALSALNPDGSPATSVNVVPSVVYTNMFEIVTSTITYMFRCGDKSEMDRWVAALRDQIQKQQAMQVEREKNLITKQNSAEFVIPQNNQAAELGSMCELLSSEGVKFLDTHAVAAVKYLDAEYVDSAIFLSFKNVVIDPLAAASRGVTLAVGALTDEENKDIARSSIMQEKGTYLNAITKASLKSQQQAITSALVDDADALLCIRTVQLISSSMREFLMSLEKTMSDVQWKSDKFRISDFFLSQGTKIFFTAFITYSKGMLAMIRLLCNSKIFSSFRKEAEAILRPHRIESILRNILLFPYKCQNFLTTIAKSMTPVMLATDKVGEAVAFVDDIILQVEAEIALKKNYEKLLEIKSGFLSEFIPDPVLKGLVTTSRTFIAEDELLKVCRKKNKPFRFWLFDDYLVYGSSAVGGYKWHHALDLSKSAVKISEDNLTNDTYTFEFTTPDKSFMLIAPSTRVLHKWVDHIEKAAAARKAVLGIATTEVVTAPVWIQDSASSGCCVCQVEFKGFFNRKHHCRECGGVVCGEHSSKKKFLPNIHATKKQRVCDNCFAGKRDNVSAKKNVTDEKETIISEHVSPVAKGGLGPPPIPSKPMPVPSVGRGPPPIPSKGGNKVPPPVPKFPPSASSSLQQVLPTSTPPPIPSFPPAPPVPISDDVVTNPFNTSPSNQQPPNQQQKAVKPPSSPSISTLKPAPPPPKLSPSNDSSTAHPVPTPAPTSTPSTVSGLSSKQNALSQSAPPPSPQRSVPAPPPPSKISSVTLPPPPPPLSQKRISSPPPPPPRQVVQPPPPLLASVDVVGAQPERKSSIMSMSLLQSIQTGGASLKRVTVEERTVKKPESGGGLLGMLATAMSERRTVIIESDDDDDDDSGWSSDDSN
jgi:hypothetical protein